MAHSTKLHIIIHRDMPLSTPSVIFLFIPRCFIMLLLGTRSMTDSGDLEKSQTDTNPDAALEESESLSVKLPMG